MFKDYQLNENVLNALNKNDFVAETDIQKAVLPLALKGKSVLGKSLTGTGKTLAYLIPLLNSLTPESHVQSVIVVPTRELAFQIHEVIKKLLQYMTNSYDVRLYVGGHDHISEEERLAKSQPQIVIGTIGRLGDLAAHKHILRLDQAKMLVVDEADMVLQDKEIESMDAVFGCFKENIQVLVFSATFSKQLMAFSNHYLGKAEIIDLTAGTPLVETLKHYFIPTKNKNKLPLLEKLLELIQPYLALIFVNTKEGASLLQTQLIADGYKPALISGDVSPRERKQTLRRIGQGEFNLVVCTDLAARGMDFPYVSDVINYELPDDVEFYIHRIGRTARNNNNGSAYSFYDFDDEDYLFHLKNRKISGEFVQIKEDGIKSLGHHILKKRVKNTTSLENQLHYKIPLGKVKPGYKKKRNEMISQQVKALKKQNIKEMYRKKALREKKGQ